MVPISAADLAFKIVMIDADFKGFTLAKSVIVCPEHPPCIVAVVVVVVVVVAAAADGPQASRSVFCQR